MPILDLQRKMAEKGRIRMGEREGNRPVKLGAEVVKLTSPHRDAIDDAAEHLGGSTPEPFQKNQWATKVPYPLNVIIPPGDMAFTQWHELWGNGFCKRRCDGRRETISDGPCQCDPNNRECKATTRLSVMLPDLAGVGLWRLESHGYYAAVELAGAVDIIQNLAPSTLVRGKLSAVDRTVVRVDKNGKPQTRHFAVPVLDLADVRLSELMVASGDGVSVQIETRSGLTPVPVAELPEGPAPSVREQLEAVRPDPKRRANAAAELPATGVPLPGEIVAGSDAASLSGGAAPALEAPNAEASLRGGGAAEEATSSVTASSSQGEAPTRPEIVSGPGSEKSGRRKQETPASEARHRDPHEKASLHGPEPTVEPADPEALAELRSVIDRVPGLGEGRVLIRARKIARDRGLPEPQVFESLEGEVLAAVYAEAVAKLED